MFLFMSFSSFMFLFMSFSSEEEEEEDREEGEERFSHISLARRYLKSEKWQAEDDTSAEDDTPTPTPEDMKPYVEIRMKQACFTVDLDEYEHMTDSDLLLRAEEAREEERRREEEEAVGAPAQAHAWATDEDWEEGKEGEEWWQEGEEEGEEVQEERIHQDHTS